VIALAESCIVSQLGAEITLGLTAESPERRWDEVLFGESASRILVSVAPEQQVSWESYLKEQLVEQEQGNYQYWQKVGIVKSTKADLRLLTADNLLVMDVTMTEMSDRFSNAIERRLMV
jgi:phosphoribosylformylglycinamidine synthase